MQKQLEKYPALQGHSNKMSLIPLDEFVGFWSLCPNLSEFFKIIAYSGLQIKINKALFMIWNEVTLTG